MLRRWILLPRKTDIIKSVYVCVCVHVQHVVAIKSVDLCDLLRTKSAVEYWGWTFSRRWWNFSFYSLFNFFVSHKHMLNVNNVNGSALQAICTQELQVVVVARCRVLVGHIWDNGNGGGALARDDGTGRRWQRTCIYLFYFPFSCVFEVAGT